MLASEWSDCVCVCGQSWFSSGETWGRGVASAAKADQLIESFCRVIHEALFFALIHITSTMRTQTS